jgi:hypothetical protein
LRRIQTDDPSQYDIPKRAVQDTEKVLRDYGGRRSPHEGFVYWGGTKTRTKYNVQIVIAPRLDSKFAGVLISSRSNTAVVQILSDHSMVEVAQVHSHPSDWVDHSYGDDLRAPFKVEGLISIVVPDYCEHGMLPMKLCGVHRFENGGFVRLPSEYVGRHFHISRASSTFCDLR